VTRAGPLGVIVLVACGGARLPPAPATADCPRGSIVVTGQEQVEALAGCARIDGDLRIRTAAPLHLDALGSIETVTGALVVGPTLGLDIVAGLDRLREVGGVVRIVANGDVTGAYLPALERARAVEISGNVAVLQVVMPRLREIAGDLHVANNPALEMVDVVMLEQIGGALVVERNGVLAEVSIGAARASSVRLAHNGALDSATEQRLRAMAP